ncbi:hypothetical protein HXY33_06720 [Candidatus Bathyarchaeota archaeon]|nr:hypothetical protein [Candidatus Bathyarchaeota archaeon]
MGWSITDAGKLEDAALRLRLELAQRIGIGKGMTVIMWVAAKADSLFP